MKYAIAATLVLALSSCGHSDAPPPVPAPQIDTSESPLPEISPAPSGTSKPCDDQLLDYATCLVEEYASDDGESTPFERVKKCKGKKPHSSCDGGQDE